MTTSPITIDDADPETLRARLVDAVGERVDLRDERITAALRAVPRHLFAPAGTTLPAAYADNVVITKRDPGGAALSSISAPWLQAYMIDTAGLRSGDRVLEIGSGGYNAALIAEVVGATGSVTSIDIDSEIVANARTALDAAGYPQVRVVCADAEYGYPDGAPYDAIIVTVQAHTVPPAWTRHLAPDGQLVVPLRMRGNSRCLTLQQHGDHLVATAAIMCGFVPMQGDGSDPMRRYQLRGEAIVLAVDDTSDVDEGQLGLAFDQARVDRWAPVTVGAQESFESLHLWLASPSRPFGLLAVDRDRTEGLLDPQNKVSCPTFFTSDSLAYLAIRTVDDATWQFGAHGFGPDAAALTRDMVELITVWDREYRHDGDPDITVHPTGNTLPDTDRPRLLVPGRHTVTAITWPARR